MQEEFKNVIGCTVYEYIKKVRMEKAKYLLKSTNMSVLEIANEIGYENPSKFANAFKEYNNVTPLKYRKLNITKY
ncbi:transcriptional regulatory protein [Clostridium tetani 12124569]|nr:transcriptional regulatory protein [Clostridium tetani 12124569]